MFFTILENQAAIRRKKPLRILNLLLWLWSDAYEILNKLSTAQNTKIMAGTSKISLQIILF